MLLLRGPMVLQRGRSRAAVRVYRPKQLVSPRPHELLVHQCESLVHQCERAAFVAFVRSWPVREHKKVYWFWFFLDEKEDEKD
jgi:hypothetical protein